MFKNVVVWSEQQKQFCMYVRERKRKKKPDFQNIADTTNIG